MGCSFEEYPKKVFLITVSQELNSSITEQVQCQVFSLEMTFFLLHEEDLLGTTEVYLFKILRNKSRCFHCLWRREAVVNEFYNIMDCLPIL